MLQYIIKKGASFAVSLLMIATLTFFLMKIIPGDPFCEEQAMRKDVHEALLKQHGFHRSISEQYLSYISDLLRGNLGYSIKYSGRSINSIIKEGFFISARLGLQAFCLAITVGVSLGLLLALKAERWQEKFILICTAIGISIPSFILASLLQYSLAIYFPLFPIGRWGSFSQTILPSLALAATPAAFIARLTSTGLQEVMKTDYIKLAKAKGLPISFWLPKRALRNAFLPVISYLGPLLANVLTGSFIIEKIFSIPGLGQSFVHSVADRDYSVIMGLILFYSIILLFFLFLTDLLYGIWDPRIRIYS